MHSAQEKRRHLARPCTPTAALRPGKRPPLPPPPLPTRLPPQPPPARLAIAAAACRDGLPPHPHPNALARTWPCSSTSGRRWCSAALGGSVDLTDDEQGHAAQRGDLFDHLGERRPRIERFERRGRRQNDLAAGQRWQPWRTRPQADHPVDRSGRGLRPDQHLRLARQGVTEQVFEACHRRPRSNRKRGRPFGDHGRRWVGEDRGRRRPAPTIAAGQTRCLGHSAQSVPSALGCRGPCRVPRRPPPMSPDHPGRWNPCGGRAAGGRRNY